MQMRMIVKRFLIALSATLVLPSMAAAEVLRSSDAGFMIEHTASRDAGAEATWMRLVDPAVWWHPDHTWSADAAGLSLEAAAGGCFCERLADGGSVEHLRVVHAAPGRLLRMDGRLGPLQSLAVTGVLTFELAEDASGGTTIKLTYAVSGAPGDALDNWAPAVDGVLGQQIERLAAGTESGEATD